MFQEETEKKEEATGSALQALAYRSSQPVTPTGRSSWPGYLGFPFRWVFQKSPSNQVPYFYQKPTENSNQKP